MASGIHRAAHDLAATAGRSGGVRREEPAGGAGLRRVGGLRYVVHRDTQLLRCRVGATLCSPRERDQLWRQRCRGGERGGIAQESAAGEFVHSVALANRCGRS